LPSKSRDRRKNGGHGLPHKNPSPILPGNHWESFAMIANFINPSKGTCIPEPFAHITYEFFGIDPKSFYENKFCGGGNRIDFFEDKATKFDIEFARMRFLGSWIKPRTAVLDLGCGSGPFADSLKRHCGVRELVGIDMDPGCIEIARPKYDQAIVFEITQTLPFPDAYFDAVYSLDFFGHVEFRRKNDLIREIFRITKPGGLSLHAIESNDLDYSSIDPGNPADPLFQYVTAEGHVGIESAERLRERWSAWFNVLALENAMIFPFYGLDSYLFDKSWDKDFRDLLAGFTPEQRRAAQICLGYVCDYLKDLARGVDPNLLTPRSDTESDIDDGCETIADKIFRKPCGLVFLAAQKPD
jgi:ubiquinone/menaquinone biosynthesis C-methylase UbiE